MFQAQSQKLENLTFGTDSTLDIVTWNIEWFPKNGNATADSVKKIINALQADVIGFQEIDDTSLFRQVIEQTPGYKFHIASGYFGGLVYAYKTSSVFAKSFSKIYDSSPYWRAFPRAPVVMNFLYKGEEYVIINNHYKCCGDGVLDINNPNDEEARRYEANTLLHSYIETNYDSAKVLVIGDLNDILTDSYQNNVFRMFYEAPDKYKFADEAIAKGSSSSWSYPSWPSHLDHILITNELFADFEQPQSSAQTILVDDFMKGGFSAYDQFVSDHRPVGLKLMIKPMNTSVLKPILPTVKIYPNPTIGEIIVENTDKVNSISIYSSDGRSVEFKQTTKGNTTLLHLKGPKGLYFLKVEYDSKSEVFKIIKY